MTPLIEYSPDIQKAKNQNRPIVALESTVISHGLPYPENLETALKLESIIKDEGATPATIAIHQGKIKVGLGAKELEFFATQADIVKASKRDLAYVLSQARSASTTVAATMHIATLADINFFATGGIGGVHRGADKSFDISADIDALATHPMVVVSAGAKAILDLAKTLEALESHNVNVIGYKTDFFPAFYSRYSDLTVNCRADSPAEIAKVFYNQQALDIKSALLIANPIPEENELAFDRVEAIIAKAQAKVTEVKGKAVTPYLLSELANISQGETLKANIALIKNNALLAAKIAVKFNFL